MMVSYFRLYISMIRECNDNYYDMFLIQFEFIYSIVIAGADPLWGQRGHGPPTWGKVSLSQALKQGSKGRAFYCLFRYMICPTASRALRGCSTALTLIAISQFSVYRLTSKSGVLFGPLSPFRGLVRPSCWYVWREKCADL